MRRTKTVVSDTYKNPEILQFTEHLHECFETGQVLHNERNVIKSCQLKDANGTINEIIVKRYKRPGWLQRIVYGFFRSSKAKRAFRNAHELRERGIDTPHEIAFTEQKCGGLLEYCYYVSESNRNRPIRDELIRPENFNRSMAAAFAAFAAELHEKGILHHDLNSTNVLYHLNDTHYNFSVIDINRMRFLPEGQQPSRKDCFENLTRFTGRMDLFEYVVRCYAEKRNWDIETAVNEAIKVKNKHDKRWKQRKALLRKLTLKR